MMKTAAEVVKPMKTAQTSFLLTKEQDVETSLVIYSPCLIEQNPDNS